MKTFLNYLGQFRVYSLLDLIILLIAVQAAPQEFLGVIFLHLGFLVFLETRHSHPFRIKMPKGLWAFLTLFGIILYRHWEIIPFLLLSFFYVEKTQKYFGYIAPFLRAFQYFFLFGGIIGYHHQIILIIPLVIFIRNFAGDLRDITKDRNDGLKTLPVVLGLKNNIKYIHLIAMLSTTLIWWSFTSLPIHFLLVVFLVQIFSYNITPR